MINFESYFVCHYQDVALLDKLIKEDKEAGKLPLLLIANAGNTAVILGVCYFRNTF